MKLWQEGFRANLLLNWDLEHSKNGQSLFSCDLSPAYKSQKLYQKSKKLSFDSHLISYISYFLKLTFKRVFFLLRQYSIMVWFRRQDLEMSKWVVHVRTKAHQIFSKSLSHRRWDSNQKLQNCRSCRKLKTLEKTYKLIKKYRKSDRPVISESFKNKSSTVCFLPVSSRSAGTRFNP